MVQKNMAVIMKIKIKPILPMLEGIRNKFVCCIINNTPKADIKKIPKGYSGSLTRATTLSRK